MDDHSSADRDAFEAVAESFVTRFRRGERPSIEDYARRYPELADQLRELLPALVLLEQNAAAEESVPVPRSACAAFLPPDIADFTILREIGRGGMGVVYEAVQHSLGRHVALKAISPSALLNPTHLERFRLEARAAARLHHTNIVPVFGVGEQNGVHYYTMQFIHGQSLDLVIDALVQLRCRETLRDAPMDVLSATVAGGLLSGDFPQAAEEHEAGSATTIGEAPDAELAANRSGRDFYRSVAHIGACVAEALAYAHGEGILHRDIKPSNLLLDAKGKVWISDFGLARDESTEGLTHTGDFVGTLRYMAPERLGGSSDRRSDLYSLGATLYELLTMRPIFASTSGGQLVDRILHGNPAPPTKTDRLIPRDLETIVLKAIAKEPAARYRTCEEMAEDLRRFLDDRPILARRTTAWEQLRRAVRRNPTTTGLAAAVAILLVGAVAALGTSNRQIRRESAGRAAALAQKDAALDTARAAVRQMLTRTAHESFANTPRLHATRVALLQDALTFYEGFAADRRDVQLDSEIAEVWHIKAGLERELDRYTDAAKSLERSIEALERIVADDPHPPDVLERIAIAHSDLAYTLHRSGSSSGPDDPAVEARYQRALALHDAIEREWPDRLQPVTTELRSLADFALRRGESSKARDLLELASRRAEAYVKVHPDELEARVALGWLRVNLWDLPDDDGESRAPQKRAALAKGVQEAEELVRAFPESNNAKDPAAALRFRLALEVMDQRDFGQALFEAKQALDAAESLCESNPQDSNYWNSLQWFYSASIEQLHAFEQDDLARDVLARYRKWIDDLDETVLALAPDDKVAQCQSTVDEWDRLLVPKH